MQREGKMTSLEFVILLQTAFLIIVVCTLVYLHRSVIRYVSTHDYSKLMSVLVENNRATLEVKSELTKLSVKLDKLVKIAGG